MGIKKSSEIIIAGKELVFQNEVKEKQEEELINANKELVIQNKEKEKRAAALIIADRELVFQKKEKRARAAELIIADKELVFQNEEKEKRATELVIANKELVFQNEEKEKRAAELIIANKELVFQNEEKEKRAAELIVCNKELVFQNKEKEKQAEELIIVNKELKKAEEELAEKEFFLRESQKAGNIGSYKINFVTGYWQSSETLDNIFGIDKNYDRSIGGWLEIVHPGDKQKMDEYIRLEVLGKRKSFNKEYRIKRINDKQTKWVCGMGDLKFDDSGNVTELIGTIQDITERKKAEEELMKSNERYEFVNKATQDTIWEWDYRTNKGKWGEGIITTFGYSEDKLNYDETWLDEYVHPDDKELLLKHIHDRVENSSQNRQIEYRFRCADGSYKYVFDRGYILYDESKKPYRMIGAMTDLTEKKRLERELAEQQIKQQKLITETIIQTQEKERNELGRELHDNINQILATVKMYLGMAKAKENISVDLVGQSYEFVTEAMEEIRILSHSLVAPSLGIIGLKEALQGLVEDANLINNLEVQLLFDEKYNEKDIDKNKELMLYRIVQEQMNNITKYGKAKNAVITLKTDDDILILSVADDGAGFDVTQKSKGIGLKNISSRVEFYSGHMNIISAPGRGCTLEIFIPC